MQMATLRPLILCSRTWSTYIFVLVLYSPLEALGEETLPNIACNVAYETNENIIVALK